MSDDAKPKLTKPQERLLLSLGSRFRRTVADYYPPMQRLVELGLARHEPGRYVARAVLTDAGRALYEQLNANREPRRGKP